jgi:hypothetical protein
MYVSKNNQVVFDILNDFNIHLMTPTNQITSPLLYDNLYFLKIVNWQEVHKQLHIQ